jgi:predicted RNase H-like HicB family nuclease
MARQAEGQAAERMWPVLVNLPILIYADCMNLKLTAVFRRFPEGYAAFVEELPGANTQGATLEEARANLIEAATMVLEANRQLAEEDLRGEEVIREPLLLGAA